jgi:hypothetical protein
MDPVASRPMRRLVPLIVLAAVVAGCGGTRTITVTRTVREGAFPATQGPGSSACRLDGDRWLIEVMRADREAARTCSSFAARLGPATMRQRALPADGSLALPSDVTYDQQCILTAPTTPESVQVWEVAGVASAYERAHGFCSDLIGEGWEGQSGP